MKKMILSVSLVFLLGCSQYRKEFVTVVDDHYKVCVETNNSILKSIDSALAENISDTERKDLTDLRNRLIYLTNSSEVIRKYVYANVVDQKLLEELINNKWKSQ